MNEIFPKSHLHCAKKLSTKTSEHAADCTVYSVMHPPPKSKNKWNCNAYTARMNVWQKIAGDNHSVGLWPKAVFTFFSPFCFHRGIQDVRRIHRHIDSGLPHLLVLIVHILPCVCLMHSLGVCWEHGVLWICSACAPGAFPAHTLNMKSEQTPREKVCFLSIRAW